MPMQFAVPGVIGEDLNVDGLNVLIDTRLEDGRWVPTFPNARYVFSRKDFEFFGRQTHAVHNREAYADFSRPIWRPDPTFTHENIMRANQRDASGPWTTRLGRLVRVGCTAAAMWALGGPAGAQTLFDSGNVSFTAMQASRGRTAYGESCAACHGPNLNDGQFAPPVKGSPSGRIGTINRPRHCWR